MADTTEKQKAKKKRICIDVKVEADLSGMLWRRYYEDKDEQMRDLNRAVKDFHDFLRDHRSQDMVSLSTEREYQDVCSVCGENWEVWPNEETGVVECANCGAEIE